MVVTLVACGKDDDINNTIQCMMSAKVDGEDFCSILDGSAYFAFNENLRSLYMLGSDGASDFQFRIENAAKGTFSLTANGLNSALYTTGVLSTHYESVRGTLTISQFTSDLIVGTFNFVASGEDPLLGRNVTFNITNGKFNLKKL